MGIFRDSDNSELISQLELIHDRDLYKAVFGRYPGQTDLGFFSEFGMMESITSDSVTWFESGKLWDKVTVASVAQNAATNEIIVTIAAASHSQAGTRSSPRVKNIVELPNNLQGLIVAKSETTANAHTITIRPLVAATSYATFVAGVSAATKIMYVANATSEGTYGMEHGLISTDDLLRNRVQTISEYFGVTNRELENKSTYSYNFNGEQKQRYWYRGAGDTDKRFRMQVENAAFRQQESASLADKDGIVTYTQRGVIPHARLYAQQQGWTAGAGITGTFYSDLETATRANYVGGKYVMYVGADFTKANDTYYNTLGAANPSVFVINGREGKGEINFGLRKMVANGMNITMVPLNALSHSELSSSTYSNMALLVPDDTVKVRNGNREAGYTDVNRFTMLYKPQSGTGAKGWFKHWETGAYASNGATSAKLVKDLHWVADVTNRFAGMGDCVLIQKTA